MSAIFSKPKAPKLPDAPPVPSRTDADVQGAAEDERRRNFASRASSWLTGGMGVPRSSFTSAGAKLLSGQA